MQLFFHNVVPQVDMISYAGQVYGNIIYNSDELPQGDMLPVLYAKALVTMGKEFGVTDIPKDLEQAAAAASAGK